MSPAKSFILQLLWEKIMNSPPTPFILPIYARDRTKDFVEAPLYLGLIIFVEIEEFCN